MDLNSLAEVAAVQRARNLYADDDLEIDDNPEVSRVSPLYQADPGYWVAAWVWVPDNEPDGFADEPDEEV